jgi:hypothetical protein
MLIQDSMKPGSLPQTKVQIFKQGPFNLNHQSTDYNVGVFVL